MDVLMGAGATFDWTLLDNSNRRKVARQPSKVVMFDSDLVQRGSRQLSNIKLVKLNQENNYV
jgi:hypothetical protein